MKYHIPAFALIAALLLAACQESPPVSGTVPAEDTPSPAVTQTPAPEPDLTPEPEPEPEPTSTVVTLAVCGDAMSHMPLTNDAWDDELERYDYHRIMAAAEPYVSAADFAVVNFETTMAGGPPYSGYPAFNSPDDMARDMAEIGFDLCLTANNHSLDRGFSGLSRTLDVMDEIGLLHVGTSRTQEEFDNNIVLVDIEGVSVAFLGYTYGTNGIPTPKDHPYAINLFNTDYLTTLCTPDWDRLTADLDAAQAMEPDLIAVMIHWGVEYQTTENSYQDQMADFLFANGADLILGGHSHVPQPMELRTLDDGRQGFVCYSLGNFISAQNDEYTDTTAVLTLELTKDLETGVTQVTDYSYVPMFMLDREEGASPRYELMDAHAALAAGVDDADLEQRLTKAIDDCHAIFGAEWDAAK